MTPCSGWFGVVLFSYPFGWFLPRRVDCGVVGADDVGTMHLMSTAKQSQHTVRDLHARVAKDLRPKNTAVNPRYQVLSPAGEIVDELTSRRAAVETARMLDATGRS